MSKESYDALDTKAIAEKIAHSMLLLARMKDSEDGLTLFDHVNENFTKDELSYISCVHIAQKLKAALESDPTSAMAITLIRKLDDIEETIKNEDHE